MWRYLNLGRKEKFLYVISYIASNKSKILEQKCAHLVKKENKINLVLRMVKVLLILLCILSI